MLGLRMIGNCEKCFHRSVCEHKKNFETIEQTDERNCGFYIPIPLFSEDTLLMILGEKSFYDTNENIFRCKDCVFFNSNNDLSTFCEHYGESVSPMQVCGYGERKE